MTVWVIAGLLALATGVRVGSATVHKQTVVSSAMIVALAGLALVAVFTWQPLALLLDTTLRWPNTSAALTQVALVACAAGSCVMVTSAVSPRSTTATRRFAKAQYAVAAVAATVSLVRFVTAPRLPEMAPDLYLRTALDGAGARWGWSVPLLYVVLAFSVVGWCGLRHSSRTRRGRALFVFSLGVVLLFVASTVVAITAFSGGRVGGVGVAVWHFGVAMVIVAAGSLLPSIEDHLGARRELRTIAPLLRELLDRHPDAGIGVRPRGPLAFRVAERMSLISDALLLEAMRATARDPLVTTTCVIEAQVTHDDADPLPTTVTPAYQARELATWLASKDDDAFPGTAWMRQPPSHSDREWILEIARGWNRVAAARDAASRATAPATPTHTDARHRLPAGGRRTD